MAGAAATQDVKARLLADLQKAVSAGHVLLATAVAVLVERNAYDLVQQASAGGAGKAEAVDERLQRHLRNVVTVVSTAERHLGDVRQAVHWYRSGVPSPGHTPEALTVAGRLEDVYRLLLRTPRGGAGSGA